MELRKTVRLSMLLALCVVLSILEGFIPLLNDIIPGLKIGLANIVIIFTLYQFSFKDAVYLSVLRVFLVGLLRTGLFGITFFFSLGGALLSIIMMYVSKKLKLSVIGVSVIGSVFHSIGQILVAVFLLSMTSFIYYLPYLLILSVVTGIFIGIISHKVLSYFA